MELQSLSNILGPEGIITDKALHASYTVDWTRRYTGFTSAILLPKNTEEVSQVLKWCFAHSAALVPQGGNTGMVGGATPMNGELVLSLKRMSAIEEVDDASGQLVAQSGTTLADVQRAAAVLGWKYGTDL
ncbi:MAG: FAD-binding oxidoreductase, partial [Acidimicrobiales bacterium]|nr:FAD-binding oxidoreductase [Acidimicrobiales bacterium]